MFFTLGHSGNKRKEKEVNLTLIDEDEESNDIGEFNIASFLIIDTLDKNDDDIGDDDLNWCILVICIWVMMVLFMTYYGLLSKCGTIWMVFPT